MFAAVLACFGLRDFGWQHREEFALFDTAHLVPSIRLLPVPLMSDFT
jgi:hypothetical protein